MRRRRLSSLFATVNVGLLICALTGVAFVAIHMLRQFADEQALARVSQAAVVAGHVVERAGHDLLIETQVLAQRPTLQRYARARDNGDLAAYLRQYCHASQIGECAVLMDGHALATSGAELDWMTLWQATPPANIAAITALPDAQLVQTAWAPVPVLPGVMVMTAQPMDSAYARQISAQVSLTVTIENSHLASGQADDARQALIQQAIARDTATSAYLDGSALYLVALPLHGPSGGVVAVLFTTLSAAATQSSLLRVIQTLLALTLVVALLAALVSLLLGRSLANPLMKLTHAAARIGAGDLTTPVQPLAGEELGTLAETLEAMRERLQRMASDLRRQRAEAEAIVTGIVEGVFSVDRNRRIRYLNPQAAAMLGVTPEAAIGRFCGDVLRPCGAKGMQGANGIEGRRPCEEHCPIIHARSRGGAQATEYLLPVATSGTARHEMADAHNTTRVVVITSAPPSEGVQVQVLRNETEIETSRRLRDTVLATISHEFQTPLAAQLASIELLLDQLPDLSRDQIRQLVLASQRGTLRLSYLINNLLESVRIEAGKDRIRRQRVVLGEVIAEAVEMTRPLLWLRGQDVALELPVDLPPVAGDAPRLTQVFVNLLANANKFAPADSVIQVGGECASGKATLWVEDRGPGLPAIEERAMFHRFVRAVDSVGEEPEQSGMGLGLWIVKSIVERHGGLVDAQGLEGCGTRIRVTLPTLPNSAARPADKPG